MGNHALNLPQKYIYISQNITIIEMNVYMMWKSKSPCKIIIVIKFIKKS
jgi:hypothetical protein